jgi:hypothetical protein
MSLNMTRINKPPEARHRLHSQLSPNQALPTSRTLSQNYQLYRPPKTSLTSTKGQGILPVHSLLLSTPLPIRPLAHPCSTRILLANGPPRLHPLPPSHPNHSALTASLSFQHARQYPYKVKAPHGRSTKFSPPFSPTSSSLPASGNVSRSCKHSMTAGASSAVIIHSRSLQGLSPSSNRTRQSLTSSSASSPPGALSNPSRDSEQSGPCAALAWESRSPCRALHTRPETRSCHGPISRSWISLHVVCFSRMRRFERIAHLYLIMLHLFPAFFVVVPPAGAAVLECTIP